MTVCQEDELSGSVAAALGELHQRYVAQVEVLIREGREDLAVELAQRYPDEALALLTPQHRSGPETRDTASA